jgi:hypothetical protein
VKIELVKIHEIITLELLEPYTVGDTLKLNLGGVKLCIDSWEGLQ